MNFLVAYRSGSCNRNLDGRAVGGGSDNAICDYASVCEPNNSCYFGKGLVFNKYTGARGKSGCNDAMPEYFAFIRKVMDENEIHYQTAELGKVDAGGGGTIAYILGNYNMYVVDAGVPVLSMHSPLELVSKADVYEAYLAYKAFLLA